MTMKEVLQKALDEGYLYYRDRGTITTPIKEVITWELSPNDCWELKRKYNRQAMIVRTDNKPNNNRPRVVR